MTVISDRDEAERVEFANKVKIVHMALDEAARACKPCSNLHEIIGFRNDVLCEASGGSQQNMVDFVKRGSCTIACVNGERGILFTDGRFEASSSSRETEAEERVNDDVWPSPSGPSAMSV